MEELAVGQFHVIQPAARLLPLAVPCQADKGLRSFRANVRRIRPVKNVQGKLHQRGRAWWSFVSQLATFACRAVKSGRKVAGSIKIKDVLNEVNQACKGYVICKLPDFSTESCNPLAEALTDNNVSEVPDQVAFHIDYPAWLSTRTDRDRALLTDMAMGHRTKDLAKQYRMSEGRVSQLRREYHDDWQRFTSDVV